MATRYDVVAEARTWLETPYRHQGRLKGVSVDCAGLIIGVCRAVGLPCEDMTGYTKRPDGTLKGFVEKQTEVVAPGAEQPGDLILLHWRNDPVHLAILTGPDVIIHAFAINRKVCEHAIDEKWRAQIACYRKFIGVQ